MATFISTSQIDRLNGLASLAIAYDSAPPVIAYAFAQSTGLITSPAITGSLAFTLLNWKALLNDVMDWSYHLKGAFALPETGLLMLHKLEEEIKTTDITMKMKTLTNDVLLWVEFTPPATVTVKPRVALSLTYADFVHWLLTVVAFQGLIAKRGY